MPNFSRIDNELPNDDEFLPMDEHDQIVSAIIQAQEKKIEMLEAIIYRQASLMGLNGLMTGKVSEIIAEYDD